MLNQLKESRRIGVKLAHGVRRRRPPKGPKPGPLSKRQRETLEALSLYIREHHCVPTQEDLARVLGVKYKSEISDRLQRLATKNWIAIEFNRPRSIRLLHDDVPVVLTGPINAGEDTLAYERIIDQIPRAVAEWFEPTPDFFVEIQEDGIDAAGLVQGDVIAVHRPADGAVEAGDIVVVRDSDEIRLRRVKQRDTTHINLTVETRDSAHAEQVVNVDDGEIQIDGVMIGALIGPRRQG